MINLRQARRDDHWRTALKRSYPMVLNEVKLFDGEVFGNTKLKLKPGINAIVGKNGIGKSNFIRAIYNSLKSDSSNRHKFSKLLDLSKISLDLTLCEQNYTLQLTPFDENEIEHEILCMLYDPCTLIPEIQSLFSQQENIDELLESFSSRALSDDDLKIANFLANTNYSSVEIISIEDEFDSFPILPFFTVTRDNIKYDSRDMGLGELSLLYFHWLISHTEKSETHNLIIIEEPESFLPPLIQNRLCDILAMSMSTKATTCLITTHSEHILKKVPRSHIHIMTREQNSLKFYNAASNLEQMNTLGLSAPKKGLIYCEDQAALIFTTALIKASPLYVIDSFIYHCSGSESEVLKNLSNFPKSNKDFSFIAIFDGDCNGRFDKQLNSFSNYIFLPSEVSPEELIINYIKDKSLEEMSKVLGIDTASLNAAINVAQGLDHHDYFESIAQTLSISYDDTFLKLCCWWVSDKENTNEVSEFTTKLNSIIEM
ncbi:ATP-dependent nuclease [Pseudoalteromonas gelatinilytica]